jgi:hypothetical protein
VVKEKDEIVRVILFMTDLTVNGDKVLYVSVFQIATFNLGCPQKTPYSAEII